ncbi:MAG: hypothetical protein K9K86_11490 [Pseudomonadales bacterium]|nr:hypothetical protein [Pseudomonadales bacterium]
MARQRRLKGVGGGGWYHLYCKAAGGKGEFPLAKLLHRRKLIALMRFYTAAFCCEPVAFCVMGNHYHLIVEFDKRRKLSRGELMRRALMLYPNSADDLKCWPDWKWERFEERIFNVSEMMQIFQSTYGRWFNRQNDRSGRFWGSRFKSVLLKDLRAVLDCMLYIDLNPVRAGLVKRPEEWKGSSYYLRVVGKADWLRPLEHFEQYKSARQAIRDYRGRLYYRGHVPTKKGQAAIPTAVLKHEKALGFEMPGMYLAKLRYFVDGVMIGSEEYIRDQIRLLREEGVYKRRKNPILHLGGVHATLREQRSHAIAW